jgi:methanogenic corrinoid protein MtbC1
VTANIDALRVRFMAAQLSGNRREAVRLVVEDGLARGIAVTDLQRHVVQAAQTQIGMMWQRNEVSIAQEHMATAISQLTLAALFERSRSSVPLGKKLVIACVQGELHDLPARLVADFLDLAGFEVRYLGASVPHDDLVATVRREVPDAVGLSVTMSFNVPAARMAVARLRELGTTPIFLGGHATEWSRGLATDLGVATASADPAALIETARSLTGLPAVAV